MSITVRTAEYGEKTFDADDWTTDDERGNHIGELWVGSRETGVGVAAFAKNSWLFVYETVDPPSPRSARVWDAIRSVPPGVPVLDKDGDKFEWLDGELYFNDGGWGTTVSVAFDQLLAPFTEVLG